MDLYLAGCGDVQILKNLVARHCTNLLYSYFSEKKKIKVGAELIKPTGKLFVDSGAFSSWTKGKVLNVDEYIKWLNENKDIVDLFAQVDCIPGSIHSIPTKEQAEQAASKTWDNYLYMREKVIKKDSLLYTFHFGEPVEYLRNALDWVDSKGQNIKYIALGGLVGRSTADRDKFLDLCFSTIKNSHNKNVKVHAFGMTRYKLLEKYPITSADSTTWLKQGFMGLLLLEEGSIRVSEVVKHNKDFYKHNLPKEALDLLQKRLDTYKFTFEQIETIPEIRQLYNAYYMQDRMDELKQHTFTPTKRLF